MGRLDERITEQFARWEQRGRGWSVWPEPVLPEPPFQEFTGYQLSPTEPLVDDGRKPTFLASLFDSIQHKLAPPPPVIVEEVIEPEPVGSEQPLTSEFIASLPPSLSVPDDVLRAFLDSLEACAGPVSFELWGREGRVSVQLASTSQDAPILQRQLSAFLLDVPFVPAQGTVAEAWNTTEGLGFIVDFGLAHEFMLPLATEHGLDPFVGLVAALSELGRNETALFQVLFQPVREPWGESVWRSVTDREGKMLFTNNVPLIPGTKVKLSAPLFGVVVRVAAHAATFERAAEIVQNVARALRPFNRPEGNELIPLHNEEYPFELHEEDLLLRQSRRSGMLLNREELLGLVHLPGDEVASPQLRRQTGTTRAAPVSVLSSTGLLLGTNDHAGRLREVRLNAEQRVRHTHIVGATGTGKSTLLFNLIRQDIEHGQGLSVLDPHGELIEKILTIIPAHRVEDVVFLDPSDEEYIASFNILSAHSDFEKNLLASDLVSVFRRLCSSWGDQMGSVLNNAIMAFLESSQGGTLSDLRRFLLEPEFRNRFLETVRDPNVVYYWRKAFPQLGGNKSIGPVLTRLDTFLAPKPIRYLVSQPTNKLDFADILDSGKILLVKLPQGQLGRENAFLLGSLVMAKLQQMAMSRQRMEAEKRRDFFIYLDEFQNFISPSIAEILAAGRKYRVGLVLAHQELHQLQRDAEVASAVMSNSHVRIVFRVGDADARALEKGFVSFEARDFQNLRIGEAIGLVERSDGDFNLSVALPAAPDGDVATRAQVVAASRRKYATPRAEVEAALLQAMEVGEAEKPKRKTPPSSPPTVEIKPVAPSTPAPPVPEAPKETRSEKKEVPVESIPELPREPSPPRDLGRGGEQHRAIQERLQAEAHKLGFLAEVESQLHKQSNQAADLVLRRGAMDIAVEITITTTTDHEFGNVKKCLAAGFARVAVVSPKPESLQDIEVAVQAGLGPEAADHVSYHSPDELIAELRRLATEPVEEAKPAVPKEKVTRGFKVRRHGPELSEAERKAREDLALKLLAQNMKPRPEDP